MEKKKTLQLLTSLTRKEEEKKKKRVMFEKEKRPSKKIKIAEGETPIEPNEDPSSSSADEEGNGENEVEQQNDESRCCFIFYKKSFNFFSHVADAKKRAITYEMSKNKGLTPHRKKEQRNPRVKHKLKYRKALIRRKGAVSKNY